MRDTLCAENEQPDWPSVTTWLSENETEVLVQLQSSDSTECSIWRPDGGKISERQADSGIYKDYNTHAAIVYSVDTNQSELWPLSLLWEQYGECPFCWSKRNEDFTFDGCVWMRCWYQVLHKSSLSISPCLMGSTTWMVDGQLACLGTQHGEQCQLSSTGTLFHSLCMLTIAQYCRCNVGLQYRLSPSPGLSAALSFLSHQISEGILRATSGSCGFTREKTMPSEDKEVACLSNTASS